MQNITAGLMVGVVICCVVGPVFVAYGLVSGHLDVALSALGMTAAGAALFILGPAVLIELIATRGKPGWRG